MGAAGGRNDTETSPNSLPRRCRVQKKTVPLLAEGTDLSYELSMTTHIPVIDLFAGPGGLGEGFVSRDGDSSYRVKLSIEKDPWASQTLTLRKFYHELRDAHGGKTPKKWLDILAAENPLELAESLFPEELKRAKEAVWTAEMGVDESAPKQHIKDRINKAVGNADAWVLVGGPPCQAYSLVGRAKMGHREGFSDDKRHRLYRHYLEIIADHEPPVFVMENVKGILSSPLDEGFAINKILEELSHPGKAVGRSKSNAVYKIHSLVSPVDPSVDPSQLVIKAEEYGIPQRRHRVILLGIREDLGDITPERLKPVQEQVGVGVTISDLPRIRSTLSKEPDGWAPWKKHVDNYAASLKIKMKSSDETSLNAGANLMDYSGTPEFSSQWYRRDAGNLLLNHAARGHMTKDLARYLFAADFAKKNKSSPHLRDFDDELLPDHKNAKDAKAGTGPFGDRFRVVLDGKPGPTVTSHISKDGHAFIHPDPSQCRSLTVREAARIQTFPDSYRFLGPRTEQYRQVGNAVPPLLAGKIADIVTDVLKKAGLI
ncbi:MAG: DNA cytosine methyltransferase [Blastochloris viridis]|uniref:DNA (cytosine-5-)-methyltransferase n=1 Tax=Blastochloris viridis TaxID=1079 RepID=A0A6N4RE37_BLAVI|nr:MAG: DNA cytosine methyltransferase [Blastochloris viridis]